MTIGLDLGDWLVGSNSPPDQNRDAIREPGDQGNDALAHRRWTVCRT